MSKPFNRKKNKKQEPPRSPPPPTSNRVEHGTFTQGKITVTLKIKYNDNYLDLNKTKKRIYFMLLCNTLSIKWWNGMKKYNTKFSS